jgi:hypothetical protein
LTISNNGCVSGSPFFAGLLSPATTKVKFVADGFGCNVAAPVGNCVIEGNVCPNADTAVARKRTAKIFFMPEVSHKPACPAPRPSL